MKKMKKSLYQYKEITPVKIPEIIKKTKSRIGYVEFTKRNGEYRKMWFQSIIPQYLLKGGELAYDPKEHMISIVRDIKKENNDCIRAIRWHAVHYLCIRNKRFFVKDKKRRI